MSTKVTLKWRDHAAGEAGFHLFWDALDSFLSDDEAARPVYLQLDGVDVRLHTLGTGGASVLVAIPRDLAHELGLLPVRPASDKATAPEP